MKRGTVKRGENLHTHTHPAMQFDRQHAGGRERRPMGVGWSIATLLNLPPPQMAKFDSEMARINAIFCSR